MHILQPLSKNWLVMVCPDWSREIESLLSSKYTVLISQWSLHPMAAEIIKSLF